MYSISVMMYYYHQKESIMLDGSEKSMIDILKNQKSTIIGCKSDNADSYFEQDEFNVGSGFADLILCNLNQDIAHARRSNDIKPLVSEDLVKAFLIICELYGKNKEAATIPKIGDALNMPSLKMQGLIIVKLLEKNAVKISKNNAIIPCFEYNFTELLDCIAIEAKISRWQRAIYQAYRYKWYADKSYVVLYDDKIQPAINNLDTFKRLNIGLMGITRSNNVKKYFEPKKGKPYSLTYRILAYERLLSLTDDTDNSFIIRKPFAHSVCA